MDMETLGVRAMRIANDVTRNVNHPDKSLFRDLIALSYMQGARDEREEFMRWRDPKEELPTDSLRVIVRAVFPNRGELITGGWYGTEPGEMGWNIDLDDRFPDLKIVGWRPIINAE